MSRFGFFYQSQLIIIKIFFRTNQTNENFHLNEKNLIDLRSPLVNETYINPRFHKLNESADESNIKNIVENDPTITLSHLKRSPLVVHADINEIGTEMNTYRVLSQRNESSNVVFYSI